MIHVCEMTIWVNEFDHCIFVACSKKGLNGNFSGLSCSAKMRWSNSFIAICISNSWKIPILSSSVLIIIDFFSFFAKPCECDFFSSRIWCDEVHLQSRRIQHQWQLIWESTLFGYQSSWCFECLRGSMAKTLGHWNDWNLSIASPAQALTISCNYCSKLSLVQLLGIAWK